MPKSIMRDNIERIRKYSARHKELLKAHHFLYDLPLNKQAAKVEFVVMGINPGETADEWEQCPKQNKELFEETSEGDYHDGRDRNRSSRRWLCSVEEFLGTDRVVLTECFFWSSRNMKEFQQRYGELRSSPHTGFCTELNRSLIEHHRPRAVVFPGISYAVQVSGLYDLDFAKAVKAMNGHRLIEHYHDGKRPWLFTKHWSGSFGFSNDQRQQIKNI